MLHPNTLRAPALVSVALLGAAALSGCSGPSDRISTAKCYDTTIGTYSETVAGTILGALTDPKEAAIPEDDIDRYSGLQVTATQIHTQLSAQHVQEGDSIYLQKGDWISFCIDDYKIYPDPDESARIKRG